MLNTDGTRLNSAADVPANCFYTCTTCVNDNWTDQSKSCSCSNTLCMEWYGNLQVCALDISETSDSCCVFCCGRELCSYYCIPKETTKVGLLWWQCIQIPPLFSVHSQSLQNFVLLWCHRSIICTFNYEIVFFFSSQEFNSSCVPHLPGLYMYT